MIQLPVRTSWLSSAQDRIGKYSRTDKKASIKSGAGLLPGLVVEEAFADYFGGEIKLDFDYDILYQGLRIDVKTKLCTSEPKPHYNASVPAANTHQNCDWYYFARYNPDSGIIWLCGGLPKQEFYARATFHHNGESDQREWAFKADCYNLKLSELRQLPNHNTLDFFWRKHRLIV